MLLIILWWNEPGLVAIRVLPLTVWRGNPPTDGALPSLHALASYSKNVLLSDAGLSRAPWASTHLTSSPVGLQGEILHSSRYFLAGCPCTRRRTLLCSRAAAGRSGSRGRRAHLEGARAAPGRSCRGRGLRSRGLRGARGPAGRRQRLPSNHAAFTWSVHFQGPGGRADGDSCAPSPPRATPSPACLEATPPPLREALRPRAAALAGSRRSHARGHPRGCRPRRAPGARAGGGWRPRGEPSEAAAARGASPPAGPRARRPPKFGSGSVGGEMQPTPRFTEPCANKTRTSTHTDAAAARPGKSRDPPAAAARDRPLRGLQCVEVRGPPARQLFQLCLTYPGFQAGIDQEGVSPRSGDTPILSLPVVHTDSKDQWPGSGFIPASS
ncbi:uncharacterized protein [Vulpes vulpes]|uniref:Collagen alpha-1(I) chain-like n=1 Tax=Vulpes vulpes TaxID=9627 RepID=A0ABM4ZY07_VULVU